MRVPGLFDYNFNQDVAGQAITYLASIPQSHYTACIYPSRKLYPRRFTDLYLVILQYLMRGIHD